MAVAAGDDAVVGAFGVANVLGEEILRFAQRNGRRATSLARSSANSPPAGRAPNARLRRLT